MKTKFILFRALVLSGGLIGCSTTTRHLISSQQSGVVTDGLQMSLSVSKTDDLADPKFEVAIQNVGTNDGVVNLGIMLANGKVQLPEKIRLKLADSSGKSRELLFQDKRYGAIGGRVDDYMVPIRAGSTYIIRLRLDQFWSPGTQEFALKLKPGRYEISAQFQGGETKNANTGMEGMLWLNVWKGKLESNVVTLDEQ